jgi:hypothetical protein
LKEKLLKKLDKTFSTNPNEFDYNISKKKLKEFGTPFYYKTLFKEWSVKEIFIYLFKPFLTKILVYSNQQIKVDNIENNKDDMELNINGLWRHMAVFILMGIDRIKSSKRYWMNDASGMFGNTFIKNLLSYKQYHYINKRVKVDIEDYLKLFHKFTSTFWNPYKNLSLDDNLSRYFGMGYEEALIKNDKKAAKHGIEDNELVDSSGFVLCICFNSTKELLEYEKKYKYNESVIMSLENKLKEGPFSIAIDAGKLGTIANGKYFGKKGRKFVILLAPNRYNAIFKNFFHLYLKEKEIDYIFYKEFICICFNSGKKFVNVITNDKSLIEKKFITRYNKKIRKYETFLSLKILDYYNKNHGFLDRIKERISYTENVHKSSSTEKVKLKYINYTILNDIYIILKDIKKINEKWDFTNFLINIIKILPFE